MEYSSHLTPVKSEAQTPGHDFDNLNDYQPFSTPCSVSSATSEGSHMMDCLTGSFTGMKLNINGGGATKRDRVTIEGSPMVPLPFKQPNLNSTPYKSEEEWNIHDFYSSGPIGIGFPTNPSSPQHSLQTNEHEAVDVVKIDPAFHTSPVRDVVQQQPKQEHLQKVLVICSASSEHNTGDHQENMLRTALLCGDKGCLRRPELAEYIDWVDSDTIQAAPLCDLLRVHEYAYLSHLEEKSRVAAAASRARETGEVVDTSAFPPFYAPPGMLDTDTPLLPQSLEAAKRFCGAAMLAVDHVMDDVLSGRCGSEGEEGDRHSRVFVIGRPPGHHAGPNGCVISKHHWQRPDMTSSGFCLLNTVAVAAAYARYQYGRLALRNIALSSSLHHAHASQSASPLTGRAPRIAIVDIDIHHGNGTEDIVRNLSPRMVHLPLPSSWAPVSTLNYKPWLNEADGEDVLFSSVHLFAGERFYPCSGQESVSDADRNIINIELTPVGPGPWDYKARGKLSGAHREELCAAASLEFRSKITSMLLPRIEAFRPDLLFISAGFDAHYDDNYHFLTEQDLHWVTQQLCDVTVRGGGHGVISVLEGGYSLSSTIPAAPKVTKKAAAAAALAPVVASVIADGVDEKGRPVRAKAKKTYSVNEGVTSPAAFVAAAVVASPDAIMPAVPVADPHFKFAQHLGDGGLVKGVLAHVAALVDRTAWK